MVDISWKSLLIIVNKPFQLNCEVKHGRFFSLKILGQTFSFLGSNCIPTVYYRRKWWLYRMFWTITNFRVLMAGSRISKKHSNVFISYLFFYFTFLNQNHFFENLVLGSTSTYFRFMCSFLYWSLNIRSFIVIFLLFFKDETNSSHPFVNGI